MSLDTQVRWVARHGLAGAVLRRGARRGGLDARRIVEPGLHEDPHPVYDEIRAMSGTKFDPEVVTAFFEILPRIEEIRSRYPDMAEAEAALHPPAAKAC